MPSLRDKLSEIRKQKRRSKTDLVIFLDMEVEAYEGLPEDVEERAVECVPETIEGETAVTGRRAHAWVEAYFSGIGWVPFEPTPAFPIPNRESHEEGLSPNSAAPVTNPPPVNAEPHRREREWEEGDADASSPYPMPKSRDSRCGCMV